jgi:hypothetical protein
MPAWSAPAATAKFRLKRRKPFALYVVAWFLPVPGAPFQGRPKASGKSTIVEWSYRRDIVQGELLLPSSAKTGRVSQPRPRFWTPPMFAEAYMGRNGFFLCFHLIGRDFCSSPWSFRSHSKALGGACAHLFRPTYAGAYMGNPSRDGASCFAVTTATPTSSTKVATRTGFPNIRHVLQRDPMSIVCR